MSIRPLLLGQPAEWGDSDRLAIVAHTMHQGRSRNVTGITKVRFLTYIS
jgi:hypothetical protein